MLRLEVSRRRNLTRWLFFNDRGYVLNNDKNTSISALDTIKTIHGVANQENNKRGGKVQFSMSTKRNLISAERGAKMFPKFSSQMESNVAALKLNI